MMVASWICHINYLEFMASIPRFTSLWAVFTGVLKSLIYGTIVAAVSCYQGYTATGGARGVGKAVTHAAVYTNFYILLANCLTSHFLELISNLV